MKTEFEIWGDPVGQGRPRFTRSGHVYDPAASRKYKMHVAGIARKAMAGHEPPEGAMLVVIEAHVAMPKSWSQKKRDMMRGTYAAKKPDADNIAKIILDGINHVCYHDDKQVSALCITKRWAAEGFVRVTVEDL